MSDRVQYPRNVKIFGAVVGGLQLIGFGWITVVLIRRAIAEDDSTYIGLAILTSIPFTILAVGLVIGLVQRFRRRHEKSEKVAIAEISWSQMLSPWGWRVEVWFFGSGAVLVAVAAVATTVRSGFVDAAPRWGWVAALTAVTIFAWRRARRGSKDHQQH